MSHAGTPARERTIRHRRAGAYGRLHRPGRPPVPAYALGGRGRPHLVGQAVRTGTGAITASRPGRPRPAGGGPKRETGRGVTAADSVASGAGSVRACRIPPGELSVANGMMTPSPKRRGAIVRMYAAETADLYTS